MKQVFQNPKSGKTHLEEITPPVVKRGGILVKNYYSVISAGTERGIIQLSKKNILQKAKERPDYVQKFFIMMKTKGPLVAWKMAQSKLATDIALGYSTAGEVIEVGKDVEQFEVGDKVACAGQDYASHAEFVYVPKNLAVKIPQNVSERDAAFVTLGSIAMQGIRQAKLSPGEKVGVVGLGLLGQLAARMLKAYGHPVIGFDVNQEQVRFALQNGLNAGVVLNGNDYTSQVDNFSNGLGVDAVLIYASAKTDDPLKVAVKITRDRGRVVQIGNIQTTIPWRDFYSKELSYISSRSYGPGRYDRSYEEGGQDYPISHVRWTERRNMEEFLRLLGDGKISVENLVTKMFDISEAEKAYELVFNPQGLTHGIVLSYPRGNEKPVGTLAIPKPEQDKRYYPPQPMVRVGLIGLGSFMASTILPHLKELKDKVRVVGISHTKGLPAKSLAESLKADYVTNDYHKLIEDRNIDLIICATRHSSHAKIAKEVLDANKNIYIEKPLALNEKDLKEVIETARKSRGRLLVGFNRRFTRHFMEARKEFASSATPLMILYRINVGPLDKAHWSYDPQEGGRILGEACHFVDALQFLTDSRPKRLWTSAIPAGGAIAHEENFVLNIEYQNGSLGTVVYSALGNFRLPKEYLEIYGDGKIMVIDNFKKGSVIYGNRTRKINLFHQDKGYTKEMELMVNAIREGQPSPMSPQELYDSHLGIFKVMEAIETGKIVEF